MTQLSINKVQLNYGVATLECCAVEINDKVKLSIVIWKVMNENILQFLKACCKLLCTM
jgi:hypothetical protein